MKIMRIGARRVTRTSPEDSRETLTLLALLLLAALPYVNTILGGFVYDDRFQVVGNPYVHSFRYLREIFTTTVWSFQGSQGITNYYRPLMTFGYLLAYKIGGGSAITFHIFNIVLHGLVVWMIFWLLRRFSGDQVALVAAGLFALHPIHTESVAWIAAVTDLELAVFYLATFIFYLRLGDSNRGIGLSVALYGSFALALLSKEQAMTLPVLVTIFEHFYRQDRAATSVAQKISRYGPLWLIATLYLAIRGILLGGVASVVSRPDLSWYGVALSALQLIGAYLWKLIWAAHFSAFYVFHASSHLGDRGIVLGLAGILGCGILFAFLWLRLRILSFALVWLFLTLGPVLNARWMPAGVFDERYLYLPSIGFCWLLGWAIVRLWKVNLAPNLRLLSKLAPLLLVTIGMIYAIKTVTRNRVWLSDNTLYKSILAARPDSSLMRSNLGVIYFDRGDMAGAEREWLQALAAGPTNVFTLDNLALLRQRQTRYAESLDYSWRALRARPVYTMAHVNLAGTLADLHRVVEADWQYRVAVALSPLSTRAHNEYGKFLYAAGRAMDAKTQYERSLLVDPTLEAENGLGDVYVAWQDRHHAADAYRGAIRLNSFDSHAHFGLGQMLEEMGQPVEALHEIESGLQLDPQDPVGKALAVRLRGAPSSSPAVSQ